MYRVTSRRGRRRVLWFADRTGSGEGWALDELFTAQEIGPFLSLLRSLEWDYRVEERIAPVDPRRLPSWNLIGRLFTLDPKDQGIPCRVVGCVADPGVRSIGAV